ncbi:MAG TPA: CvpA family protein [Terriglobales bacterium]|nr:CvpA family protein [Terriglobales bacterium]
MNAFDYILIAMVGISTVAAASKGFVYEVWMFAATLAGIGIAGWMYPAAADWIARVPVDMSLEARNFAGFGLILVLVLLLAAIVGRMGRGAVHAIGLGWADRILGAGLGLVRGVALAAVVVVMLAAYPIAPGAIAGSTLAPPVLRLSRGMESLMPADVAGRLRTLAQKEMP